MSRLRIALFGALALPLFHLAPAAFSTVAAQVVVVRPAAPRVVRPLAPRPHYMWVEGGWVWRHGAYVYRPGRWVAPRRGYVYRPGHWATVRGGYRYAPGVWVRIG